MLEPAPPRLPNPLVKQQKIGVYMRLAIQAKARRLSDHLGKPVSAIIAELIEQEYADHARLNGWIGTP